MKIHFKTLLLCLGLIFSGIAGAQALLNKPVSMELNRQRLDHVLEIMSNKGNFYFSYHSNIVKKDSLVTMASATRTVKQWLEVLLPDHYEFRESGNYIIIRKTPVKLTLVTNKAVAEDKFYQVSGYVLDDGTGDWIHNASIYETSLLLSTLTNASGFFKLRFKQKNKKLYLTVSKEFYRDTSFVLDPGFNQQVTVTLMPRTSGEYTIIGPDDYFAPEELKLRVQQADSSIVEYTYSMTDSIKVEKTRMGGLLATTQQKIQGLNIRNFFATRPFQFSITPGLGTHGQLSPQVTNHFSLNLFGGYNGGVDGVEIGGLFNIDKKSVRYFQSAGLFNIVGGYMHGFQVAGINNTVLDSVIGFQAAGVNNMVKGKMSGFQVGGVYNHVTEEVNGVQVGGVGNFARRDVSGVQVAGVMNFANRTLNGVQVSGVINYAKHVKGVQIGLINISDTSEGLGIGLINVVFKGYHKLSFYADELVNANAAFKTGSRRLYNILQAGMNFSDSNEVFTFGYGFGTEMRIGKTFSLNPEFTLQHLYLGSWDYANLLGKAKLNLNIRFGKYFSVFGGPVVNAYRSRQDVKFDGYRLVVPPSGYKTYNWGSNVKGWLGWNAGINFF
ncbi:MAG: hypothetical protein ACXWV0_08740 [Flavisolibacter sp.]